MGTEEARTSLRADLNTEYQAIARVVSEFEGRLMIVKGWSVTLSFAVLGLGIQQGHYGLFALAGLSAVAFWIIDTSLKRHEMQYYARMRDIEVAAFHLNHLRLSDDTWTESSPRVDWYWGYDGRGRDYRTEVPQRRDGNNVQRLLKRAPWMGHVMLPHLLAVILGFSSFLAAALDAPGLADLPL